MDIKIVSTKLLPPKNIKITYVNSNIQITWDNVSYKNYDVFYNIYRCNITNGAFIKLNQSPIHTNKYIDKTNVQNANITHWYRISSLYKNDNTFIESELSNAFIYKVDNTNKWFHKMNERNMWILKMDGELFDLYKRKLDGERCICYDEVRGQSARPDCDKCYGTGYIGGYDPVYQLYIRLKPAQSALDRTNRGLSVKNSTGAWTICDVQIKDRDLLISPQGKMFRVVNAHINHAAGYYFHQELNIEEIETNDPVYKIQRDTLYPFY